MIPQYLQRRYFRGRALPPSPICLSKGPHHLLYTERLAVQLSNVCLSRLPDVYGGAVGG